MLTTAVTSNAVLPLPQCFKGPHLVLTLAVGVPGIVLVCLGIPLGSLVFLRITKPHHSAPKFAATFGLMYAE
jgi:hypothetical protein